MARLIETFARDHYAAARVPFSSHFHAELHFGSLPEIPFRVKRHSPFAPMNFLRGAICRIRIINSYSATIFT